MLPNNNNHHPPGYANANHNIRPEVAAELARFRRRPQHLEQMIHYHNDSPTTLRFSLSSARSHYKQREFAEAVLNYVAILKLLPAAPGDGRRKFIGEFLDALRAYLRHENDENRADQVIQIAQSIYPAESALWRTIAEYLFEKGKFLRCVEMFARAMDCARDEMEWLHAASSKENARANLFDVWHWRMLNDAKRNTRFAEAILAALDRRSKDKGSEVARVLDIGCGSGIFSVVAAYSMTSADCVACERDEVMCTVARRCFERNGAQAKRIELHECDSKKLELTCKCDVLVTETLDCALFGERIVETVLDAKERLLNKDAIIIPSKAVALFSLLDCDYVAQENAFECPSAPVTLLSACCYIRDATVTRHDRYSNRDSRRPILPPAPYNCAYLNEMPPSSTSLPSSYRLISEPVEGLIVDFNNMHQLRQINSDLLLTEVVIQAKEEGLASAVCVWFRLNLFDGIDICTSPDGGFHWQQALYPFYPPVRVSPGDSLHFEVFVKDHALHVQPINHGTSLSASLPRELLRAPASLDLLAMHDPAIRDFFMRAVRARQPLAQVLDCTELLLPLRSDNAMTDDTRNAQCNRVASAHPAIRYIGRESAMSLEKAICKPGGAILFWPFSSQGTLMDDYCAAIIGLHIRSPGTILIPGQIALKGCLISSDALIARCALSTTAVAQREMYCGVDLSSMDEYRVTHFQELEHRSLNFQTLSEPVQLFQMRFSERADADLGQLTKLKHEAHFVCARPGRCDAILLWFECATGGSTSESNDPESESDVRLGLRLQTHSVKSAAYILPAPIVLQEPARNGLKAQYSLHHGNVLFHWVKDTIFL